MCATGQNMYEIEQIYLTAGTSFHLRPEYSSNGPALFHQSLTNFWKIDFTPEPVDGTKSAFSLLEKN
jgi:hypothetical protein